MDPNLDLDPDPQHCSKYFNVFHKNILFLKSMEAEEKVESDSEQGSFLPGSRSGSGFKMALLPQTATD